VSENGESDPGERTPAPAGPGPEDDGFEIPVFDSVDPGPGQQSGPGGDAAGDAVGDPDRQSGGSADRPGPADPADLVAGGPRDRARSGSAAEDPGTLGEEVRKLWEVVQSHFVEPVLRNYPEAAGHLTSAGLEVASAFKAMVRGSEQRWTGKPPAERADEPGTDWDGRIVIGEDGGDTGDDRADRPTD
jgi:hypothetical protein